MPSARDAREWAAMGGLHGIGDSLYTPFSGPDGDDIDWDAYRALVRYCVGDLGHAMLWLTSGIAEWWSLTGDERRRLVEVAVDEARTVAPDTVIQACTSAASEYARDHGLDELSAALGNWYTCYPGRADYFTHWGEAFRCAASVIGLPMGDYPHSRPPQGILPDEAKRQMRAAFESAGLAKQLTSA